MEGERAEGQRPGGKGVKEEIRVERRGNREGGAKKEGGKREEQ